MQSWVESGKAQMVVGNHELNLLRDEKKHGNHWFFGRTREPKHPEFGDCIAVQEEERAPILEFFRSLPVALERRDLRIVHAAWIDEDIDRCRFVAVPVDAAYKAFETELLGSEQLRSLKARHDEDFARLGPEGFEKTARQPTADGIGPYEALLQCGNPIRVITSGVEQATRTAFKASGKWRFVERVRWWEDYASEIPVLFGHYWRWWNPEIHHELSKGEPHLFAEDPIGPIMAHHHRAFCVDFSVGSRFKQRHQGHEPPFHGRLAAMRWPERILVFDAEDPAFLQLAE